MSSDPARARIRAATERDAAAMARVFETTWDASYRAVLPPEAFESLPRECSAEYWQLAVECREPDESIIVAADESDVPVGFASAGPERFGSSGWAEIYSLYVLPDRQRRGLGRRLVCESFRAMHRRGYASGIVWVLAGHESRNFYARLGGLDEYERTSEEWGARIAQAGFVWDDLGALWRGGGPCAEAAR
jgi:GNAT superfamily N-acetyltransferase